VGCETLVKRVGLMFQPRKMTFEPKLNGEEEAIPNLIATYVGPAL
jgi:hypothetical protein